VLNAGIALFEPIVHFLLHTIILPFFRLHDTILVLELPIKLLPLILQPLHNAGVPLLDALDVFRVYLGDSLFEMINL
jgi:hypothetical protein